ncbi:MAG TPA: DUF885 domain-containing protein [Vicinamibacterales bacterium]|nr:DUF885 domain-containing protein [Vicinamibacterales bacterium]
MAQAPTNPSENFRALLDEDWKYWMAQYPETATSFGFPGQDARWTDYSRPAIEGRNKYLKQSVDRIRAVDRARLERADQLNYDLYLGLLQTAVEGLQFGNDAMPVQSVIPHNLAMPINQLEGIQTDLPRIIALSPSASVADYENRLKRFEGVAALVDQTIALMRDGMARGLTPPRAAIRDVPSQVEAQLVANPMESPMLSTFASFPAAIETADRDRLSRQAAALFTSHVKPAFAKLHEFLVSTYLPACRETIGADALPNGAAMYAYNVRWHTTTGLTPKEIHEIGQAEVTRIRALMDEVMAQVKFTAGFEAFKKHLRTSPEFFYRDPGALVTGYRDIAKRADPELAHLFGTLPRLTYGVERVPDAIAPSQTTAYYEPGAPAAGRPGNMYVNTYKLDARPKWEMEALTLHEAVPGHHLQIAIAQELGDLPEFRKNTGYTAFVEGWALYSEGLGDEMGFYQDPFSRFGQLTYEMWRAVRLVVDTGLHSMGWTRQQAIDFFAVNAAKTAQDIGVEVDRYIVWPGQALGYKIGQLKIRELRSAARKQQGAGFDLRAFHDVVLGQGAVPLDVLEKRVQEFMKEVNMKDVKK